MHLRQLLKSLLKRQDITGPCAKECNNVLAIAQSQPASPALCESNSTFLQGINSCESCIVANGEPSAQNLTSLGVLDEYLDFCTGTSEIIGPNTTSIVANTRTADPLLQSILSEEAVISSLAAQVTSLQKGGNSSTSTLLATTTSNVVTPGTISSLPTTSQTSLSSSPKPPSNKTWIAAPVIGAIAFLLALWFGIDLMRGRRKAKAKALAIYGGLYEGVPDKAQLHSDSIPVKERFELKGSDFRAPAELPAVEPAATELDANTVHIADDS